MHTSHTWSDQIVSQNKIQDFSWCPPQADTSSTIDVVPLLILGPSRTSGLSHLVSIEPDSGVISFQQFSLIFFLTLPIIFISILLIIIIFSFRRHDTPSPHGSFVSLGASWGETSYFIYSFILMLLIVWWIKNGHKLFPLQEVEYMGLPWQSSG